MRAPWLLFLAAVVGCGKPAPPPPTPVPPPAPGLVDVYPFAGVKPAVFDAAIRFAEEHGRVRYRAAAPVAVVWDRIQVGGKANSAALAQLMVSQARKLKPEDRVLAVIGVSDRDIGTPGSEGVCFASSKEDRAGVLSWYLLANETLGLPADDEALGRRAGKQLVILTARLLGLERCGSSSCILAEPKGLPALDSMSGDPCASCRKAWDAAAAK